MTCIFIGSKDFVIENIGNFSTLCDKEITKFFNFKLAGFRNVFSCTLTDSFVSQCLKTSA